MSSDESKYLNTKGCVPQNTLIAYLNSSLSSVEMNAVERHLSGCPMCSDELEGLELLGDSQSISSITNSLNSRIDSQIANSNKSFWVSPTFRVAASIILLFAITGLIYFTATLNPSSNILSENLSDNEEFSIDEEYYSDSTSTNQPKAETLPKRKKERVIVYDIEDDFLFEMYEVDSPAQVNQKKDDVLILADEAKTAGAQPKKMSSPPAAKTIEIINIAEDNVNVSKERLSADMAVSILSYVNEEKEIFEEDEIFTIVEEMPTFSGGDSSNFREYISKNLKYPQSASENGIQGRVFVGFVVERDGSVSNVKIIRGVDPQLDKEAVRVIQSSPKWNPGKQRGIPVRVTFTFPVVFVLQ
jgi:protein TonB